ncbi:class I lanthipeptide [Empedobacter sp.]|uniref:class I lanthipeptide n=1 Tax=Empedobacter sp. TaxID=1927715 RepID=UPI0028AA8594|nr:class I lanthipeptide [Empedobacter sp.]
MQKKKLSLKKKKIINLTEDQQKSVTGGATGGCSDGCGGLTRTWWNCTERTCTDDCGSAVNCNPTSKSGGGITCTWVEEQDGW